MVTNAPVDTGKSNGRLDAVLVEVVLRRRSGAVVLDDAVCAAHPELMPELGLRLHAVRRIEAARARVVSDRHARDPMPIEAGALAASIPGFSIVRELHRGGQGVVYLARQQSTGRDVALKVMRAGPFASPAEQSRFEREIQILAQLQHPHIVAIHDSGTAAGGFYYAMDYVAGLPLDTFARSLLQTWRAGREAPRPATVGPGGRLAERANLEALLRLFTKVCDAVNAAHLRGIIHRDLKPSNIRVDAAGEPRVLDFGLAKLAGSDARDDDSAPSLTMTGQFVGSLSWAAPEQAEGAPAKIDMRTDVYALGVTLYQLLTGRFPYEVRGNFRVVLDNILHAEPQRLRCAARARPGADTAAHRNPRIDRDLETIVLKCLCKERERRYQSAGELAHDLRRYLKREPIEARATSAAYQVQKLLARHKLASAAVALVALLTLGFSMWLAVLYQRALGAERSAAERAQASDDLAGYLLGLYEHLSPRAGENIAWATSLSVHPDARTTALLKELIDSRIGAGRAGLRAAGDELQQATQIGNLGWLLVGLNDHPRAWECFQLADRVAASSGSSAQLLRSYLWGGIGACSHSWRAYEVAADYRAAAYQLRAELLGDADGETKRAAYDLAHSLLPLGRFAEAEVLIESAPARDFFRDERLAQARALQGRYADALPIFWAAHDDAIETWGADSPEARRAAAWICVCLLRTGRVAEADELLQQSCSESGRISIACDLANWELARYFTETDQPERALALFEENARRIAWFRSLQRGLGRVQVPGLNALIGRLSQRVLDECKRAEPSRAMFAELMDLAEVQRDADSPQALLLYRAAAQLAEADPTLGRNQPLLPLSRFASVLLANQRRFAEAEEMTRHVYERCLEAFGRADAETARTGREYADALLFTGRFERAEELLREHLPADAAATLDGYAASWSYEALGAALLLQGDCGEAEGLLRSALERRERWSPPGAAGVARARLWLCACLFRCGQTTEAEAQLEQLRCTVDQAGTSGLHHTHPNNMLAFREIVQHFLEHQQPARALELFGERVGLAERFVQLNQSLGPVHVPGLRPPFEALIAQSLAENGAPADPEERGHRLRGLGWLFHRLGDNARALEAFEAATELLPDAGPAGAASPRAQALSGAAAALLALRRFDDAADVTATVYASCCRDERTAARPDATAAGREYATALLFAGRPAEAERVLRHVLPAELELLFPESAYAAQALERLGAAIAMQGRYRDAQPLFQRARQQRLTLWDEGSGPAEPSAVWLAACCLRTGDTTAGVDLLLALERAAAARGAQSIVRGPAHPA